MNSNSVKMTRQGFAMTVIKRVTLTAIFACLLLGAMAGGVIVFHPSGSVEAAAAQYGVVTGSSVNVRAGAGTSNNVLTTAYGNKVQLSSGKSVVVEGTSKASDGSTWYKVTFTYTDGIAYTGYMSSAYVTLYARDSAYDSYLEDQGFPESYREQLQALHALYPNWVFTADVLDDTWQEALAGETVLGRSLVSSSSIASYKSTASGAYDWTTGTWAGFDGASWVAASDEIVAYCLDPRNFLTANQIFQFELLSYDSSTHTADGVKNILAGSFMDSTKITNNSGTSVLYADAIMDAAKSSGVSPYHLASRILQEQGTSGSSGSISGTYVVEIGGVKYSGYYNYYNIGAYAASGRTAVANGIIYAMGGSSGTATTYGRPWDTRYKSIMGGASYIGSGYINVGQDTLYYEKFDFVGTPYTHQYMTNVIAPQSEASTMSAAYSDSMKTSTAFVFKIPVFQDMPEQAAAKPESDESPNNYLSALSVTGQTLSPTFSGETTEYSLVVANSVSSITVKATAADSTATISGTGSKSLSVGTNTITVKVTAENGNVRNYTILVTREGGSTAIPTVSMSYTVVDNSYLKGFTVGAAVSSVLKNVSVTDGTAAVTNSSDKAKSSSSVICTGDKVVIYDTSGSMYMTYQVILYGDITGDGALDLKDLVRYKNVLLGNTTLSAASVKAGDITGDGALDLKDLVRMKNYILGKKEISQS